MNLNLAPLSIKCCLHSTILQIQTYVFNKKKHVSFHKIKKGEKGEKKTPPRTESTHCVDSSTTFLTTRRQVTSGGSSSVFLLNNNSPKRIFNFFFSFFF